MQYPQFLFPLLVCSLLMGLAGCAAKETKSSSETTAASIVSAVQGQARADEPKEATSESESVQERGVLRTPMPPSVGMGPPLPGPAVVGPTDNITKVANALQVKAKSLTIQVAVAPGLALTQPITISIAYIVLKAGGGPERMTQTYVPSTGNRFVNFDGEGDGHPRRVNLDINLSEPKPSGGMYSYNVPIAVDLDPLYDVTISPLTFKLFTDCDVIGDSEIHLIWNPPDSAAPTTQSVSFGIGANKIITISAFRWNRAEVSASAKLHKVSVWFYEYDPAGFPSPFIVDYSTPLIPDKTQPIGYTISETRGQHCSAWVQYTITYHLHRYPLL